jgi:hypothetical protein
MLPGTLYCETHADSVSSLIMNDGTTHTCAGSGTCEVLVKEASVLGGTDWNASVNRPTSQVR